MDNQDVLEYALSLFELLLATRGEADFSACLKESFELIKEREYPFTVPIVYKETQ